MGTAGAPLDRPARPTRSSIVKAFITVAAVALATLIAAQGAGAQTGTTRNGELVADGAWCWFQDPRALHYVGAHDRTYIGYVNSHGDVEIVSQDAGTAALRHTTLHAAFQADDHAAPGLVALPDGRIAVFYAAHTGKQMIYRISQHAEDITAFGRELTVATNTGTTGWYTYANPIYLSAERRLYLFFRGGDSRPTMTSTTDFKTWTKAVDVVVPDHTPYLTRPYAKYATNGKDTIAITFTDGHPDELRQAAKPNSVYTMIYQDGVLSAPDGTELTEPAASGEQDLNTALAAGPVHTDLLHEGAHGAVVYDAPDYTQPAWLESTMLDPDGKPVVVYSTYQDPSDAQYRYARWTGTEWKDIAITGAGGPIEPNDPAYSGGADIDRNDPDTVYLSRQAGPGSSHWDIKKWSANSPGTLMPVTQNSTTKNVRPVIPWGPQGEIKVLWMSGTYTDWSHGYKTQLRELTAGHAPTTSRISASTPVIGSGQAVNIGARVEQGYEGAGVPGATVDLLGHTAGHPDYVVRTGTADSVGLVTFTVRPSATMRFTVRARETSNWGYSISPSALISVARAPAVRISTSATSIKRGHSVVVGMRAVNARTAPLPRATVELWQRAAGRAWQRVGRYTTSSTGLVQVTRSPTLTVTYQARLVANSTHPAASSATITVRVL